MSWFAELVRLAAVSAALAGGEAWQDLQGRRFAALVDRYKVDRIGFDPTSSALGEYRQLLADLERDRAELERRGGDDSREAVERIKGFEADLRAKIADPELAVAQAR